MRRIHGSCHCGNIRFDLDWPDPGPDIPVRACGCSFCRKHGGVWTSNPGGRFRLQIADGARVNPYRFGTESADFHICASCGAVPIVTCTMGGARYAVVNANAFDNVDRAELAQAAANFEGESMDDRLARRRRNWTPEAAG
jgi:hypothetical protein